MAKLNIAPTKSNLLALKRQLLFAQEGYDLLEQKRQILVFELMSRLKRARAVEQTSAEKLTLAFEALTEAVLDIGSYALDKAIVAVRLEHRIDTQIQPLMGLKLPVPTARIEPPGVQFGVGATSANTDLTMSRFAGLLTTLLELAELQTAVLRLASELRKTQRRCNALSKVFIPDCTEAILYISSALEERERESFIILKMIRKRLLAPLTRTHEQINEDVYAESQ